MEFATFVRREGMLTLKVKWIAMTVRRGLSWLMMASCGSSMHTVTSALPVLLAEPLAKLQQRVAQHAPQENILPRREVCSATLVILVWQHTQEQSYVARAIPGFSRQVTGRCVRSAKLDTTATRVSSATSAGREQRLLKGPPSARSVQTADTNRILRNVSIAQLEEPVTADILAMTVGMGSILKAENCAKPALRADFLQRRPAASARNARQEHIRVNIVKVAVSAGTIRCLLKAARAVSIALEAMCQSRIVQPANPVLQGSLPRQARCLVTTAIGDCMPQLLAHHASNVLADRSRTRIAQLANRARVEPLLSQAKIIAIPVGEAKAVQKVRRSVNRASQASTTPTVLLTLARSARLADTRPIQAADPAKPVRLGGTSVVLVQMNRQHVPRAQADKLNPRALSRLIPVFSLARINRWNA